MLDILIRPSTREDDHAIDRVHFRAFGRGEEASLVGALHNGGFVRVSLVAEIDGEIVGHILFSEMTIDSKEQSRPALSLAPMAVLPQYQKKGVGSRLVRHGLRTCRDRGHQIVIVLGHPEYYPRFGFSAELAKPLDTPFPGEAFMALELIPGALNRVEGTVVYPPPFDDV